MEENDPEELDFSIKPYEEWVSFLFDREVPQNIVKRFKDANLVFKPEQPIVLVNYLTRLCRDLPRLIQKYDWPHIDQGLWGALSVTFDIPSEHLWNSNLPLEPRIECVRAMESVYHDVVAKIPSDVPRETIFEMWWDLINDCFKDGSEYRIDVPMDDTAFNKLVEAAGSGVLKLETIEDLPNVIKFFTETFPTSENRKRERRLPVEKLNGPNQPVLDAVFETMKAILEIDDRYCQAAALHGFGHCAHPGSAAVVQDFIDRHRDDDDMDYDFIEWLEQCQNGTVM